MASTSQALSVIPLSHASLERFTHLWREDWLEEHPADQAGADRAVAGLMRSLRHHDFLSGDSFWIFVAERKGVFVGYITAARIPKADARLLFLYVDELFVLKAFRRQGIATALLHAVHELARTLSAKGVRLLVDPENVAARSLYEKLGFSQTPQMFCQKGVPRG